jgi:hypothetical protein
MKFKISKNIKVEKINYRMTKKKYGTNKKKINNNNNKKIL